MYLQEIVEVAIGLVFAWLLLSLAVLQVQEIVANIMAKRSSDLERAIRDLLDDPEQVKQFYDHPLIKSLSKPKKLTTEEENIASALEKKSNIDLTWRERRTLARLRQRPSYIPSSNFASAIFDIVTNAGTEKSPIQGLLKDMKKTINEIKGGDKERMIAILDGIHQLGQAAAKSSAGIEFQDGVKTELKNQINLLGEKHNELKPYTIRLIDSIDSSQYDLGALFKSDMVVDQLRIGTQALLQDNSKLGKSINSLFAGAGEYAESFDKSLAIGRKNVEAWFDSTMDRMTGWYKRWSQKIAFVIALVVAIAFNIDSIHIAAELWNTPALRQASAAYVEDFIKDNSKDGTFSQTDLNALKVDLEELKFPIGWNQAKNEKDTNPWLFWFMKVVGWFITAGAAMQGAPFWFDTLKKLVNIRSSGTNPAEKPKESTSDKER